MKKEIKEIINLVLDANPKKYQFSIDYFTNRSDDLSLIIWKKNEIVESISIQDDIASPQEQIEKIKRAIAFFLT